MTQMIPEGDGLRGSVSSQEGSALKRPNHLDRPISIFNSWLPLLRDEFSKPYMQELRDFLQQRYRSKAQIFPKAEEYFAALNLTPFEKVRVVILGQDPYHGVGQAHGLCFSVRDGVRFPPSLVNIFKELHFDLKVPVLTSGDLSHWAEQGVLLLNSVLTVEEGKAGAHQNRGWEKFTDFIINELSQKRSNLAFVLWGKYAIKKGQFIDRSRHFVLESPHPSPLSAHSGFFGSRPFSQVNNYLKSKNLGEIQWAGREKKSVCNSG